MAIPDDFDILFTQGGTQIQFSAMCYNLLTKSRKANVLINGCYGKEAAKEMAKFCTVNVVEDYADMGNNGYGAVREASWKVAPDADFFFYIDNETGNGFEYHDFPFDKVPAS